MASNYGSQSISSGARNFIYTEIDRSGKHVPGLNKTALDELKQMGEKLIVVSIVGAYRTGKSYLLSRLLRMAESNVKFVVGHKIEPQTKGLWLMVVDHPFRSGYKLALVDTEGIGDTEKGDTQHDTTLFVLTCLLSNTLIYNGKNAIDETAFEKLGFTAEMSKYMISKTQGDDANFHEVFPELLYVVRDFSLDLESKGCKITSDEYLEKALAVGESDNSETPRSKVRKCIQKYFRRRRCFTLDIPAAGKKVLKQMDTIEDEKLNEDFVDAMTALCRYILMESQSRSLQNGREINGHQLAVLVETYVNAYRDGKVPNVSSAMENMKIQENRKAVDNVLALYVQAMKEYQKNLMPTDTREEVIAHHVMVQKNLIVVAQTEAILDDSEIDIFVREVEASLDERKKKFVQENERLSIEACDAALKRLYAPLATKRGTTYNKPGGYNEYRVDVINLERAFQKAGLGVMKKQIWLKFAENEKANEQSIMETDKLLSEKEKEVAAQRQAAEQAERERERSELEKEKAEKEARESEARLKESEALKEEMKKQNEEEKKARVKLEEAMVEMKEQHKKYADDAAEYKKMMVDLQKKEQESAKWWSAVRNALVVGGAALAGGLAPAAAALLAVNAAGGDEKDERLRIPELPPTPAGEPTPKPKSADKEEPMDT